MPNKGNHGSTMNAGILPTKSNSNTATHSGDGKESKDSHGGKRSSSAGPIGGNTRQSQNGSKDSQPVPYRLAHEPSNKSNGMARSSFLAALRKGEKYEPVATGVPNKDGRNSFKDSCDKSSLATKPIQNPNKPIQNNLIPDSSAVNTGGAGANNHGQAIVMPIGLDYKQALLRELNHPSTKTVLNTPRANNYSSQDAGKLSIEAKEIKPPPQPPSMIQTTSDSTVLDSIKVDRSNLLPLRSMQNTDLREIHAQMVKGNILAHSVLTEKAAKNLFGRSAANPLLPLRKLPEPSTSQSQSKALLSNFRKKLKFSMTPNRKSDSKVVPVGVQLPIPDDLFNTLPKVPYCNSNAPVKFQRFDIPSLKYAKSHRAIDQIQQVNAEIERIHKITSKMEVR